MLVNNRNRIIIVISFFTALTAIGAYIKIPLPHIPITLQTFFVIMSGNLLGYKFGSISQILYLILGLMGIPIFAYGGGPGYIFQPSFGYLLGYPVCAFIIGIFLKLVLPDFNIATKPKKNIFFTIVIADVVGILMLFIFGLGYLYVNIKYGLYLSLEQINSSLDWKDALKTALFLFLPIDLVKVLLAAWLTVSLKRLSVLFYLMSF